MSKLLSTPRVSGPVPKNDIFMHVHPQTFLLSFVLYIRSVMKFLHHTGIPFRPSTIDQGKPTCSRAGAELSFSFSFFFLTVSTLSPGIHSFIHEPPNLKSNLTQQINEN